MSDKRNDDGEREGHRSPRSALAGHKRRKQHLFNSKAKFSVEENERREKYSVVQFQAINYAIRRYAELAASSDYLRRPTVNSMAKHGKKYAILRDNQEHRSRNIQLNEGRKCKRRMAESIFKTHR